MIDVITCKYSCDQCGIIDVEFDVEIRRKDQEVVDWVGNTVGKALVADHRYRSPECRPMTFNNLMIPRPKGTTMIGRPVEH